jgi:hypothetical protein
MLNVILPSGESNFFDLNQAHFRNNGNGINTIFPDPDDSGIYRTYPQDSGGFARIERSGIFMFDGISGKFSSGNIAPDNLEVFNPYVHYYTKKDSRGNYKPVEIPYASTYKVSVIFNPYESRIP